MADFEEEDDFNELDGSPEAEEPVHAAVYNPDVVHQVGLGSIETVTLINFMCHDNFSIKFGPQVNFVVGRNGSGKSAILTALVVCFGGRAGVTSRGKAVRSFIKKGETVARVIVELCNHSENNTDFSFRYEAYGRRIVIERTFRTDGSSSYLIRNASGEVVEKAKKEVDCIVHHFSIQIDNPVVILNQEVSRNFLSTSNAKVKYKFFMRATNLEDHKDNIIKLKRRLDWANRTKEEKEQILPDLEAEVRGLEQKLDHLKSVKGYRTKKEKKEKELLWSHVRDKEVQLAEIDKNLAAEVDKLDLLKKNAERYDEKIAGLKLDQESLAEKLQDQNNLVNEASRQVLAARKELEKLDKEKQKIVFQRRDNLTQVKEKDRVIEKYEEGIRKEIEKQGDPDTIRQEREERQRKIGDLENQLKELEQSLVAKNETVSQLKNWLETKQGTLDGLSGDRKNVEGQVTEIRKRIEQLESSRGDNRAIFARWVPRVNALIEEAAAAGKFRVKPIGPIGQYITLKDRNVSTALQSVMKNLVRAYAVDNADDQSQLRQIFREAIPDARQHPQVITRKFARQKFDVASNLIQHEQVKSLLEYITVADVNAFNVLIDKTGLETIAYIAENAEAERILMNIRTVPLNCRKAYSRDGTEFNPTTRTKGFSMYPNEFNNHNDVFSLDIAGQAERLKEQLVVKEQELERIMADGRKQKTLIANRMEEVKSREKDVMSLRSQRNVMNKELAALKDYVEPEPISVASLQSELDEFKTERSALQDMVKALTEEIDQKEEEIGRAKTSLAEKEEAKNEADTKLKLCLTRRTKLADDIRNVEASRSERDLSRQSEKVTDLQTKRDEAAERVAELVRETSQKCERVESRAKPDELRHQIKELGKLIADCEKETGAEEEVTAKYKKSKNNLAKIETVIAVVTSCNTRCSEMLTKRRKLYYETRNNIVVRMKEQFEACLRSLEYTGSMVIEHGGREIVNGETVNREPRLTLRVNPRGAQNNAGYNDTRSLSGGERSYSTVAFLLALWEGCSSPFRILDEVDVFMDMVTRHVAMDALVTAAHQNRRQYIFLSPLPLIQDHANRAEIVIHNMPEPHRVGDQSMSD